MRTALLVVFACSIAKLFAAEFASDTSRPSPDAAWLVSWHCARTWQPKSCSVALSRATDGKVFFTHRTSDRYIAAMWSADSTRCLLLDAPDNANSYLWLFRVRGREVATEKLDYEKISERVEAAVPATRRKDPGVTRSGIEKIEWASSAAVRLHITYNNLPVLVVVDVTKPNAPSIRVLSSNKT
jgi:hypothetical protein